MRTRFAPCSHNPNRRCSAMRTVSFSFLMGGLLLCLVVVFPSGVDAQGRAVQECRNNVADAERVSAANVQGHTGPAGGDGNPVVEWEASLSGRRIRGFCETSRNGQVLNTQLGFPRSSGGFGNGGGIFGRNNDGGGRNTGGGAI